MADKISIAEKVLKRKKDKAFQKELQSEILDVDADITAEKKQPSKSELAKKKRNFKLGLTGIGVLLVGWLGYYLFKPYQGDITFGVCRVFLEQNVQYPQTIRLSKIDELSDFIRIWYTQTDGFGQYRMDNIQCTFEADNTYGFKLKKVSFNRRQVDPARVDLFNKSLPFIFANPPDLTYPSPIPDSLQALQFDTSRFRKIILEGL